MNFAILRGTDGPSVTRNRETRPKGQRRGAVVQREGMVTGDTVNGKKGMLLGKRKR